MEVSTKNKHPDEYRRWKAMRWRCSPRNKHCDYYARGIKVCSRWNSFDRFLEDMGLLPTNKHTLDRVDNNGNYEPNNCRWATYKEQANNTRRTNIIGDKTLTSVSEETGIPQETLRARLKRGLSLKMVKSKQHLKRRDAYGRYC